MLFIKGGNLYGKSVEENKEDLKLKSTKFSFSSIDGMKKGIGKGFKEVGKGIKEVGKGAGKVLDLVGI